jgi:hypothetical protein
MTATTPPVDPCTVRAAIELGLASCLLSQPLEVDDTIERVPS